MSLSPLSFLQPLLLSTMSYGIRYPFHQMGSAVPAVTPAPNFLFSLLAAKPAWETEEALTLCKQCSAIAETLLCYQHCCGHKSKTQHHMSCSEESELYPSKKKKENKILILACKLIWFYSVKIPLCASPGEIQASSFAMNSSISILRVFRVKQPPNKLEFMVFLLRLVGEFWV